MHVIDCMCSVRQWLAAPGSASCLMNKAYLLSKEVKVQTQVAFADSPVRSLKVVVSVASERTSTHWALFNSPHDSVTALRATGGVLRNHNAFCLACLEGLD